MGRIEVNIGGREMTNGWWVCTYDLPLEVNTRTDKKALILLFATCECQLQEFNSARVVWKAWLKIKRNVFHSNWGMTSVLESNTSRVFPGYILFFLLIRQCQWPKKARKKCHRVKPEALFLLEWRSEHCLLQLWEVTETCGWARRVLKELMLPLFGKSIWVVWII